MRRSILACGLLALLGASLGCNHKITAPGSPNPTPTPTPTLGCLSSSQWTLMPGTAPDYNVVVVLVGTQTPQPTPTQVTGVVPTNLTGNFVIRNQADWDAYVATSQMPGLIEPLPFDPNTEMLLVLGYAGAVCQQTSVIEQVCYEPGQVTVTGTTTATCCGNPPGYPFNQPSSLCLKVPRSDLPVVWNITYVPLPANAYLYCI